MLTEIVNNPHNEKLIISTGNILNNVDNAAPLRKPNEEILDSLKLCTECQQQQQQGHAGAEIIQNGRNAQLLRANQELRGKITENQRQEISIGVKLFMNKNSPAGVEEAIQTLMEVLKVDYIDNLVLAYHTSDGTASSTADKEQGASGNWSKRNVKQMDNLIALWQCLEKFAKQKQICQLGIADLDCEALKALHANAKVPPTIAQINLANCCVVPPELKEFCTQHDIQLLTHGDPEILLTDVDFTIPQYTVDWSLRYQVHVRCRGVLTAKGYILQAIKNSAAPTANSQ